MRASFHKLIVPIIALFMAGMLGSCKPHRKNSCVDDPCASSLCSWVPPPDVQAWPSVDARQIETQPIPLPPPDTKPIPPRPPETQPVVPRQPDTKPIAPRPPDTRPVEVKPPVNLPPVRTPKTVRIKAGSPSNWKDKDGNDWLADAGFSEGAMVDYGRIKVENTSMPDLYTSEHTNMEKFTWPLPNGKYRVKLHFAENLDDIKKAGDRVFSVDVNGQKLKDLDIFKEAGGLNKALVKELHVNVTGGKLEINFKPDQKDPLINGIEILPE